MEDSTNAVRPHKPYAKHGRSARKATRHNEPGYRPKSQPEPPQTVEQLAPKTEQPSAIPRPISKSKLISSKGLDKIRIVRLLLAGASPKAISEKIDIGVAQCQNLIKEIDKDIVGLGWKDYLSLLLGKLRLILDNHTQNSADIQLAMLDVDVAIKAQGQAIKSETDKRVLLSLQAQMTRLRGEQAALRTELNTNNLALTTNLSKMGVTTRPPSEENKVPTQSSIASGFTELEEVPIGYEKMDRAALLEGMAESNRAVGKHLKAERDRKRSLEGESE